MKLPLREAHRLVALGRHDQQKQYVVRTNAAIATTNATSTTPGLQRVVTFLNLLRRLDKAPWASEFFDVNERMMRRLVHSHLPIIVGRQAYEREKSALVALVNAPDVCQNVVWVTNRQQGKTTTLSKLIAALMTLAPVNGTLVCIYSTNLDRATEVLKGAKQYLQFLGADKPAVIVNNERSLTVRTRDGFVHSATARPRSPDSCRGDAPASAIFDEIAFVLPDFWYQFAYPLLSVRDRVFTCATTPPAFGSFFSEFIDGVAKENAQGNYFFRLINHGLVCPECEAAGTPLECAHRLHRIPPWKSIFKFQAMQAHIPEHRREEFEQEVYGLLRKQTGRYIPEPLVTAFRRRAPIEECSAPRLAPVYVGIDPPSHHSSEFGMCAMLYGAHNEAILVGLAQCKALRSDALDIAAVVAFFMRQIRGHPWVGGRPVVPIIECNNNEVLATTILGAVKMHGPVFVPFGPPYFNKDVTADLGVWTTEDNKHAMLALAFQKFMDGMVFVAPDAVSCKMTVVNGVAVAGDFDDALALLCRQLVAFHDNNRGKISGKIGDHSTTDLAMAMLLNLFWGYTCLVQGLFNK